MNQLDLEINARNDFAKTILTTLESAIRGSTAQLRGSLAENRSDAYSDIDILWEVPDDLFSLSTKRLAVFLSSTHKISSLRSAPDFQNSDKRRLIFVQFEGMPLFWRVDIDICARSIQRDPFYDLHNQAAKGNDWSLTYSALMNAVAAIKALLRHREDMAEQLLIRGFERIGLRPPDGNSQELILILNKCIAEMDSTQLELTQRITELHQQVFG